MSKSAPATIVVAVNLDHVHDALLETANTLCLRTKSRLKIVASCQPIPSEPWHPHLPVEAYQGYLESFTQVNTDRALALKKRFDPSIDVEVRVLNTPPADGIIAEAVAAQASLILVGRAGSYRFVPTGFSTALSLMATSPIPVMAISETSPGRFAGDGARILIADDLSDGCLSCITEAFQWGHRLGRIRVKHVYVNPFEEDSFVAAFQNVAGASRTPARDGVDAKKIFALWQESLAARLSERTKAAETFIYPSGIYEYSREILSGVPRQKIFEAAAAFDADLVVFGRHETFHHKPFAIGDVPFATMMKEPRPIMVVPPRRSSFMHFTPTAVPHGPSTK